MGVSYTWSFAQSFLIFVLIIFVRKKKNYLYRM